MFKIIYLVLFIGLISITAFAFREYERCENNITSCIVEYATTFRDNVQYLYKKFY